MYEFSVSHPGYKFSHVFKLEHSSILRIALPQSKLCSLEELELQHTNSTKKVHDKQEMYAKMALLMFYPYQKLNTMTDDGSNWKENHKELQCHLLKYTQNPWERVLKYFKI
jgi:hypothetical protein